MNLFWDHGSSPVSFNFQSHQVILFLFVLFFGFTFFFASNKKKHLLKNLFISFKFFLLRCQGIFATYFCAIFKSFWFTFRFEGKTRKLYFNQNINENKKLKNKKKMKKKCKTKSRYDNSIPWFNIDYGVSFLYFDIPSFVCLLFPFFFASTIFI